MENIHAAHDVIRNAERSLQKLISEALASNNYDAVGEIALLADKVANLLPKLEGSEGSAIPVDVSLSEPEKPVAIKTSDDQQMSSVLPVGSNTGKRQKPRDAKKKVNYPAFVRDEDRLVKIGWSKKSKDEYEHRIPKDAVMGLLGRLNEVVDPKKIFDIDSLFPVRDSNGEEVPAYQVYAVIAWLRHISVIEKKGRDGYLISDKSTLGEKYELWESIQAVSYTHLTLPTKA